MRIRPIEKHVERAKGRKKKAMTMEIWLSHTIRQMRSKYDVIIPNAWYAASYFRDVSGVGCVGETVIHSSYIYDTNRVF